MKAIRGIGFPNKHMRSQKIQLGLACMLVVCAAPAMACSPSSDPTERSKYEEYLKGKYRFWGVVVAQEPVPIPPAPLRGASTVKGLRIRIVESPYPELPVSKEFRFVQASTGGACQTEYQDLSIAEYPVGTELLLGSDDLLGIRVRGFSRSAAHQCPDAVPAGEPKPTSLGEIETLNIPSVVPTGYSGCHYHWYRYVSSREHMTLVATSFFEDGHMRWHSTREHFCAYESGTLTKGQLVAHRCPESEAELRKRWSLN
ncbi:hypothetical protein [Variovorax sp. 350MFTsu5.1]|uniref:hypothetical protein n=1 Tax=Variovorax sp. 350MFTsu5.1 TaxID=3158365 RepID=UPI003AAFA9CA